LKRVGNADKILKIRTLNYACIMTIFETVFETAMGKQYMF